MGAAPGVRALAGPAVRSRGWGWGWGWGWGTRITREHAERPVSARRTHLILPARWGKTNPWITSATAPQGPVLPWGRSPSPSRGPQGPAGRAPTPSRPPLLPVSPSSQCTRQKAPPPFPLMGQARSYPGAFAHAVPTAWNAISQSPTGSSPHLPLPLDQILPPPSTSQSLSPDSSSWC